MQTPLTTREAWLTHFAEQYLWPRLKPQEDIDRRSIA